jgi:hypothetical protein
MIELPRQVRAIRDCLPVPLCRGAQRVVPLLGRRPTHEAPEFRGIWPAMPKPRACRSSNAALKSLAGSPLAGRFRAWHGASGRRYVFSVFPLDRAAPDGGLPEFAHAVVIAVARTVDGRRLVSIRRCESGAECYARESLVLEALAAGACEWHVHLLASEAAQRRVVLADITAAVRGRGKRC